MRAEKPLIATVSAWGLLLLASGVPQARGDQWVVGGVSDTFNPSSTLLLFRIGDQGELAVTEVPVSVEADRVMADPMGRYVLYHSSLHTQPTSFVLMGFDGETLEVVDEITASPEIIFGFDFAISPSGEFAIVHATVPSGEQSHASQVWTLRISPTLEIDTTGFAITPDDWFGFVGGGVSPYGSSTVIAPHAIEMAFFRVLGDGSMTTPVLRVPLPDTFQTPGLPSVSQDGRWAVVAGSLDSGLASIHLDGLGGGHFVDQFSTIGLRGGRDIHFHPSQRFVFVGQSDSNGPEGLPTLSTAAFNDATGEIGPLLDWHSVPGQNFMRAAVTTDGRFALLRRFTSIEGYAYQTLRLRGDGSIEPTGHQLTGLRRVVNLSAIPPRPTPGDANRDGRVDAADVTTVVNDLVGKQPIHHWIARENADLDTDQDVDVNDLTLLIDLLLGL